ncbi:hypothetical protein Kisp01_41690 [Kineosporia sp. NBRC 101677]|nr:hypothetical protein Kisp01_41690 [Kineosporia sp. NBRC 101677]
MGAKSGSGVLAGGGEREDQRCESLERQNVISGVARSSVAAGVRVLSGALRGGGNHGVAEARQRTALDVQPSTPVLSWLDPTGLDSGDPRWRR